MDTRKNNKVLSVSYGHFSCSVEGFDDSFEVMTSVVEFFRNLAQEDRYFGAEPVKLTPDLIAELSKKTQTSDIEVTQDADNLTVRKSSPTQMAPVATSAAFALNERLKRLRAAETDMSDNADSDGETDLVEIVADPKPQTIDPKPTKSETTTSVTAASDDTDASATAQTETAQLETGQPETAQPKTMTETVADTTAAAQSEPPADEIDDTETVPTQPQGLTQPDNAPTDIPAAGAELEIEHSPAADGDMPAETAADAPTASEPLTAAPTQTSPTPPSTDTPAITLEQRLRRIQAVTQKKRAQQNASAAQTQAAAEFAAANDQPDATPTPAPAQSEPLILQSQSDDDEHHTDGTDAPVTSEQTAEQVPHDTPAPENQDSSPQRTGKTHVVQVADTSQNDAADDSARADTDPQTIDVAADNTTDTAAQEPQEATISLRQAPEPDKMEITPKRPERTSKRITRNAENLERPSTDMVRLLKAAKEQMDEPETHRKRNALEHLRAAVAATLADNSILSRDKSKREREDTSEDNIAPKRPAKSKSAATGVPVTPLVLQMDQRVDMDKSGSSTPEADSA